MHPFVTRSIAGSLLAILVAGGTATPAAGWCCALRAPTPWNFRERSPETALTLTRQHMQDDLAARRAAQNPAGDGGLGPGVTIINSNSYAIGNWQQIEMTLGDGAEGLIMTENHQDNGGDAQAISEVLTNGSGSAANGNADVGTEWAW